MFSQKKIAMIVAEFLGVAVLTMAVYSMLARTSFPLFSGLAGGATIALMVVVLGGVSGAHLNPAVTLSMWVMRKVDTAQAAVYIAAQVLGGLAAWALINYFIGSSLKNIAGENFEWKVLIAEAVGAAVFAFGATAALIQKLDVGRAAIVTGVSFALGAVVASLASNGIINPAVALGLQSWDWSYAVGPLVGAIVGSNLYAMLALAGNNKFKLR